MWGGRERGGRMRMRRRRMKTTISKPPTTLRGSSLTSKGTIANIYLKKVDVKFSLFMPHRHIGEVEV